MDRKKLIVVAGPTAVGKTSLAVHLARIFTTEVVSADSRQIYREMTIGTAKPSLDERGGIRHYFIDTHSVGDAYDAASYATDALAVINNLFEKCDEVILCGGSGLYIKGVCEGFDDMPEVPDQVRADLMANYEQDGISWLQEKMRQLDPETFEKMDQKNPHRLIRALEIKLHTGQSIATFRKYEKKERSFRIIKIGLELGRAELHERIDSRMDQMIARGLFDEARSLYPMREFNALQTVGYQEIFDFMDNQYDMEECVRLLKRNSRRYAKRQLTWFRKDAEFKWFSPRDIEAIIGFVKTQA